MFELKPVARSIAIALGGLSAGLAMQVPALAQDQQAPQQLERVEITGSSIKRIEGETALPVTVIKREEIDKLGVQSTADLLDKMTANNGAGYGLAIALGDAARPGFTGASLRGLGSNSTLVLLNGRRLAVYAFDGGATNINSIPFEAIERVEILRDGASAIYGSDAVGGVINFITRKDFKGIMAKASAAKPTTDGGGQSSSASFTYGYGDLGSQGWNVFANLGWQKQDSLKAKDRSFSHTAYRRDILEDRSQTGSNFVNRLSSNAFPGNILDPNAGFVNPYAPGNGGNCLPPVSFALATTPTRCRFDYASVIDIVPDVERLDFVTRGTFQINASNELFAELVLSRTKNTFRISPTPASEATTHTDPTTGLTAQLLYPATGPYYPGGSGGVPAIAGLTPGDLNLYYRTIELGPRTNEDDTLEGRFMIGMNGTIAGWDYKTALARAESHADEKYTGGYVLESKLLPAMATGQINPFGYNTGAGLALLQSTQYIGDTRNSKAARTTIDGSVSRDVAQLPAGPVSLALGAQYEHDTFDDIPKPILNSADIIGGAGVQPVVQASRNITSLFAEANVPIVKTLETQLAVRTDKYSDFGTTTNPKLGVRFQPINEVLFRGSLGKGFRAPTLVDMNTPFARTNSGGVYDDPYYDNSGLGGTPLGVSVCNGDGLTPPVHAGVFNPRFCGAQLNVANQGNSGLQPEKSDTLTFGILLEPSRYASFGIDYFKIKQTNLIGYPGADTILADFISNFDSATMTSSSVYAPFVHTHIDSRTGVRTIDYVLNQIQNIADQETQGIDLSFKLKTPRMEAGQFSLGLEGTYLMSQKQKNLLAANPTYQNVLGTYALFGPVTQWKTLWTLGWDQGPWAAQLNYSWQSSYQDNYGYSQNGTIVPRIVGTYEIFDVQGEYSGFKDWKLIAGIHNLLNRNPPSSNQNQYFQVGYDPTYANPLGRVIYLTASYTFK